MSNPQRVALGKSWTSTPLNPSGDKLSTDALIQDQHHRPAPCPAREQGNDAWTKGKDEHDNDMYYVSEVDGNNKAFYIKVAVEGIKAENDNVIPEDNDIEINGTKYKEVEVVTRD
ncbi:hypothetical protein FQN54_007029 [Arachnomyces sp. PD_36]|nr:hypothetical protein FQN54_007029 [Arachnomyces sp. PD_36]